MALLLTSCNKVCARSAIARKRWKELGRRCATSTSNPIPSTVDILVVGGGLVGGSLAAALAADPLPRPLSIALVDPSPPTTLADVLSSPVSLRTSTISPSSRDFLRDCGVWDRVPPERIARFSDMLVWDQPSGISDMMVDQEARLGTIHFDASDLPGAGELGVVVDNETLRAAIYERLLSLSKSCKLHVVSSGVARITYPSDEPPLDSESPGSDFVEWPRVDLETGESVTARLIVAADGARSRVRTLAQFDWFAHSYGQSAVVANVALDRPVSTAYQRFLSTGPVALLPIAAGGENSDGRPMANVIWSTTPTEAEALLAADDVVFVDEVNAAFRDDDHVIGHVAANVAGDSSVLSAVPLATGPLKAKAVSARGRLADFPKCESVVGSRGRFPLTMGHAPKYVDARRRTVLLGDAAHSVHPLAGQGANLGFADARSLLGAIASAAATGRDIGGEEGAPLMQYERERVAANVGMMLTLHSLQSVFGTSSSSMFNLARRVGVSALDRLSPFKRMILKVMS